MQRIHFHLYTQQDPPQKAVDALVNAINQLDGATVGHIKASVIKFIDCTTKGHYIGIRLYVMYTTKIPTVKELYELPNVVGAQIEWPSYECLETTSTKLPCICIHKEECTFHIYGQQDVRKKRPRREEE